MNCKILRGAPGDGKTLTMLGAMLTNSGRYLLASPRIDLLEEQISHLHANRPPDKFVGINAIHSKQRQRARVERRLEDALCAQADASYAIVGVTHETLLKIDPGLLKGWHVGIDEIPDGAIKSGKFKATTTWSSLERYYSLVPVVGGNWWEVRPREGVDQPSLGALANDGHSLLPFHAAARDPRRPLLVDIGAWEDASLPGRGVGWFSVWTMADLAACASVTIAAASFQHSLVYHAHRSLPGDRITFEEVRVRTAPRAKPRVRLHYFCEHRGSTEWWKTNEGEHCLVEMSKYLESIGFSGYWSCNETIRLAFQHRYKELWREPRQSGTNSLREHTSCAIIYSNKAQAADEPILDVLGLDRQAVLEAREYEDLWQFVMRGAIRDPAYAGSYDVYVYSRDQAEVLKAKLVENSITDDVTVIPVVEAGLLDVVRPGATIPESRRASDTRSLEERREETRARNNERQRQSRAAKREQKERSGTLRGRGRPRKQPMPSPAA
ncbi:hypothetical protein [Methylobacterium indicum]|uniref:Uncharacterized protein n=1 Tax=Methylobacterium indicum TaxID=1775910 RepID=A0A8H8WXL5_9HYPH|nr:hypothetical protein [Methylobacterium indicum]BCM86485.1 hypothetical protein mvi_49460 [Methylobacterium indicum]